MSPLQKLFSHIVRQTDDLNFETFLFRFFSWLKKKRRLAFIFLTNQRARVFCSCRCCCCCCLNRGIDSKNDVVNEDCYQQKRFLFFVLPSSQITHIRKRRIYLFVGCGRVLQNSVEKINNTEHALLLRWFYITRRC